MDPTNVRVGPKGESPRCPRCGNRVDPDAEECGACGLTPDRGGEG